MHMALNMFSSELLAQREKFRKECKMLQALVDAELEESTFIWYPQSNYVHVTYEIFRKEKRIREEDAEEEEYVEEDAKEEPKHTVLFKVEGSQFPPSFVLGFQTPEPLTWLLESPQTPWLQKTE
jgi:hypothetical protein